MKWRSGERSYQGWRNGGAAKRSAIEKRHGGKAQLGVGNGAESG
jgi:hypothetical protein